MKKSLLTLIMALVMALACATTLLRKIWVI